MRTEQASDSPLLQVIRERIERQQDRAISFRDYMDLCLYHPGLGYYMNSNRKIGRTGDFYTSASVGSVLGDMLAAYLRSFAETRTGDICLTEWGGGDGALARQMLDAIWRGSPELYGRLRFISVEKSPIHRGLQAEALAPHTGLVSYYTAEEWHAAGPWHNTLVFSNELPDAFPVHRIVSREAGWREIRVGWDHERKCLTEVEGPISGGGLEDFIRKEAIPPRTGQRFEVNLDALRWLRAVAGSLGSGSMLLTIDYGHEREELYAPHRMNGTLLCYRKHQASDTPLQFPGEQDMTAHVNFSALMDAGKEAGLESSGLLTQKQFLLEQGLLDELSDHDARDPFSPQARRNRAIRQLLLSDRMSELFKVLIQKKGEPR
ncbi:class I SAM-dependent methyltransferase [Paenibacillus ehimensis]|uniref:class I SAM-dependent methyltransferase n=1 Tax=Paenibacillus ehimensis TaxID=79264 RepID=UPI000FD76033|nr:SAM-dependent methyltransferase [Paenibacillus ehimensis]